MDCAEKSARDCEEESARYCEEESALQEFRENADGDRKLERGVGRILNRLLGGTEEELDARMARPRPLKKLLKEYLRYVDHSSTIPVDRCTGRLVAQELTISVHKGRVEEFVLDEQPAQRLKRLLTLVLGLLNDLDGRWREFVEGLIAEIKAQLADYAGES